MYTILVHTTGGKRVRIDESSPKEVRFGADPNFLTIPKLAVRPKGEKWLVTMDVANERRKVKAIHPADGEGAPMSRDVDKTREAETAEKTARVEPMNGEGTFISKPPERRKIKTSELLKTTEEGKVDVEKTLEQLGYPPEEKEDNGELELSKTRKVEIASTGDQPPSVFAPTSGRISMAELGATDLETLFAQHSLEELVEFYIRFKTTQIIRELERRFATD